MNLDIQLECLKVPDMTLQVDHSTIFNSNSGENETRIFAGNDHNSEEIDSSSELNRLSGELNEGSLMK